jgi:hypothetical protein
MRQLYDAFSCEHRASLNTTRTAMYCKENDCKDFNFRYNAAHNLTVLAIVNSARQNTRNFSHELMPTITRADVVVIGRTNALNESRHDHRRWTTNHLIQARTAINKPLVLFSTFAWYARDDFKHVQYNRTVRFLDGRRVVKRTGECKALSQFAKRTSNESCVSEHTPRHSVQSHVCDPGHADVASHDLTTMVHSFDGIRPGRVGL